MDKFGTLGSPNCRNFVWGSKHFIRSGMNMIDSIIALKDHLGFKYVYGNIFSGQSKNKIIFFRISFYFSDCGLIHVKRMQVGGDLDNSWIMFNHVKHIKD